MKKTSKQNEQWFVFGIKDNTLCPIDDESSDILISWFKNKIQHIEEKKDICLKNKTNKKGD